MTPRRRGRQAGTSTNQQKQQRLRGDATDKSKALPKQQRELFDVICSKNIFKLKDIIKDRCRCNSIVKTPDIYGHTALHWACSHGTFDMVKHLVHHFGCDINAVDRNGCTPLHWTLRYQRTAHQAIKIAQFLVETCGASVTVVTTHDASTPLHYAARYASTLFKRSNNYYSAAINEGNDMRLEYVPFLAKGGVTSHGSHLVNAKDANGMTAMHYACQRGTFYDVLFLIHNTNVNVNEQRAATTTTVGTSCSISDHSTHNGWTALHFAVAYRHVAIVKLLMQNRSINVDAVDDMGRTPLHVAVIVCSGSDKLYDSLRRYAKCGQRHRRHEQLSMVQYLVEMRRGKEANLMVKDCHGATPLHYACLYGSLEIVQFLLRSCYAKTDFSLACDAYGMTALHYAAQSSVDSFEKIQFLIQQDVMDTNSLVDATDTFGRTALHVAAASTSSSSGAGTNVIRVLLEHSFIVNK